MNKFIYFFLTREVPSKVHLEFRFYGKGSEDILYKIEAPFELKSLTKEHIAKGDFGRWDVKDNLNEEYSKELNIESHKQLITARQENFISLDAEERITGDYVVAVDAKIRIDEWKELSYNEWGELHGRTK